MAEHADLAAHGAPVGDEVPAEHGRLTRVHRQQTRENLEQTRLAGPVRAAEMHDLAFANFQASSCEEGESAGERYGLVETNSRRHEERPCYGAAGALVTRVPGGQPAGAPSLTTARAVPSRTGPEGRSARSGNLAAQQLEVGVDHHLDEPREVDVGLPTELLVCLGCVADEEVNLGRPLEALVDLRHGPRS